jgi:thiol-disulfide isomerase/thioredoxin
MFRKVLSIVVLCAALLSGCTNREKKSSVAAPDFTLQDLSGKSVSLAGLRGKVVLLEFWATWCPPCRASIPAIERLYKTYGSNGLVVLGISLDEGDWDSVKSFTSEYGITYPVLKGTEDVSEKYLVRTIPLLVVVNKDGMITRQFLGDGNEEVIEKEIKTLL